jgi:PAS domain S-box-containing protein
MVRGHGTNLLDRPGVEAVVVAARDVTPRRRARAEAERAHTRLEAILDTIAEAVLLVRPDGTIAFANHASREILGREPGELLGRGFRELPWRPIRPDGSDERDSETRVADLLLTSRPVHDIALRVERDGEDAYLAANAAPLQGPEEEAVGVVVSFRDETERVEAGRALRRLNAELERRVEERTAELSAANEELEAFAYSVSHDLRAPLRALDGFSRALAEDYEDRLEGEALDFLRRIRANAQRMARLIDDILQLSRVARKEVVRAPVDVAGVVREVVEVLRQGEPNRRVELVVEPDRLPVDGDPKLVRVAVQNLVENAWKFTEPQPEARIEVRSRTEEGRRWVEIRDNGVGFEMEYADKLFKAFHRLHRDSEFDGTGIGLATVHRIVRRHGGEVRAEGAVGEGATVAFTLERGTAD